MIRVRRESLFRLGLTMLAVAAVIQLWPDDWENVYEITRLYFAKSVLGKTGLYFGAAFLVGVLLWRKVQALAGVRTVVFWLGAAVAVAYCCLAVYTTIAMKDHRLMYLLLYPLRYPFLPVIAGLMAGCVPQAGEESTPNDAQGEADHEVVHQ